GNVRENEGLPPVFPIVIYNGGKAWKAPQDVAALFAPMPESLKFYRPQHRHFLLDESSVSGDELDKSTGLVAQLLRLERAQEPEQVRQIVRELISRLHGPEYLLLRRAFTVWLGRVVLKRSGITEEIPEFQDLREVDAMLEERAAQWKDEYIQQGVMIGKAEGRAEGRAEGKAEGIGLALRDLLEARFGTLPQSVTSYIASSSDSNALRKLTLSAYHAESLQAFIDQIKKDDAKLM
ncbi:Rpn family recombination-promoting nuclease/putative transposase, partial [Desulfovibrio sp. ZJ200]|uniref:Rpn family recombination-promoting nuclease/putative transposase n=1 Tax=Desulfovibrio sp. ZJ200 TaxID=2709792 RepID=UPI0013EE0E88